MFEKINVVICCRDATDAFATTVAGRGEIGETAGPPNLEQPALACLHDREAGLVAGRVHSLLLRAVAAVGNASSRSVGHMATGAVEHGTDATAMPAPEVRGRAIAARVRGHFQNDAEFREGTTNGKSASRKGEASHRHGSQKDTSDCAEAHPEDGRLLFAEKDELSLRAAPGGLSSNTERAVRSDVRIYTDWCAGQGRRALPANEETVAAFVDAMATIHAPATVRRYIASVAVAHRALGYGEVVKSPLVSLALRRMHRRVGRRQAQAHGLTWRLRERLLGATGDRLIDARNCALVAVAYDAMLRRSELVSLQVNDLTEEDLGDATLLVRSSKTDSEGRGEVVYLAPDTVALVRAWLRRSGISGGRLFRSVSKAETLGDKLDPSQVPRILKGMASRAGLPSTLVEHLSGHSPRVGAAQDMIEAGIELPAILQAGRWKSTAMVKRYGERLQARGGGAAQLARRQRRT